MNTKEYIYRLKEVANIGAGNSAPQNEELFKNGIYPFIRTSDVGKIHLGSISESRDKLNEEGIKGLKFFKKGTILFPKSGASTFLNHRVIMEIDGYVASHLATIKAKEDLLDDRYLLYFLQTLDSRSLVLDSDYPSLKLTTIQDIELYLPSISLQKQIVEKLDAAFADIDKAISATEKNIENAEALFFSVCKEIINSNQARKSSLDSLFDISSGGTPSKKIESYWNGDIPWYSSGELNYLYTIDPDDCISEEGLKNSNAKLFPRGSLLIGMYDTAALKMSVLDREAAFNQAICGLKPNNNTDIEYIYYALNVVKPDVLKLRSGVRQQNLNQSKIKNIEITCPELSIQKGMSEKLGNIFQKQSQLFEIYVNKISFLIALKSSILIQAFSGELTKDAA